ncbi:conserved hypothetical protein [Candidatus Magnetomoraceae bacterium gMMP-15]
MSLNESYLIIFGTCIKANLTMNITENIKEHIPYYLTQPAKDGLIKSLKDFPEKMNYYTCIHKDDILQGDGWNCLDILNFETAERKSIKGIILSNSCDISPENSRDLPIRIVFAPIISLDLYKDLLIKRGVEHDKVSSKINSIKEQKITSLFYLPKGGNLESEHIAVLDDLHTLPANHFYKQSEKKKQFTLSQAEFYLFLLKLSIHFCRFHENVFRDYEHT